MVNSFLLKSERNMLFCSRMNYFLILGNVFSLVLVFFFRYTQGIY